MKGKKVTIYFIIIFMLLLSFSQNIVSYAIEGGNNGEVLADEPYGDSGLPSSYEDCKYYDVWIPYNKTVEDVGGIADDVKTIESTYDYTAYTYKYNENRMGAFVQTEYANDVVNSYGLSWSTDSETGLLYTTVNGAKIYHCALGKGLFCYSPVTDGEFFDWAGATGILFDIILTDGTVIHFVLGDGIGQIHSNQVGKYDGWTDSIANFQAGNSQDDTIYHTTDMPNEMYSYWFQCASTHMFEVCGSSSKFMSHYNIGSEDSQNQIMYVRIYNLSIGTQEGRDKVKPVSGKEEDYKVTVSRESNVTAVQADGSDNSDIGAVFVAGQYSEMELSAYAKLTEMNIQEIYLDDAQVQNLNGGELSAVTNWKNNVDAIKEETAVQKIFRVGTQLVGILFSVWMLLLYLGFWFDRLNNFFEFSVVEILSFGRLRVSDTEEECTFKATELSKTDVRTVNHRAILTICLIGLAFGVLIITGILYSIISKIVVTATNFFK